MCEHSENEIDEKNIRKTKRIVILFKLHFYSFDSFIFKTKLKIIIFGKNRNFEESILFKNLKIYYITSLLAKIF